METFDNKSYKLIPLILALQQAKDKIKCPQPPNEGPIYYGRAAGSFEKFVKFFQTLLQNFINSVEPQKENLIEELSDDKELSPIPEKVAHQMLMINFLWKELFPTEFSFSIHTSKYENLVFSLREAIKDETSDYYEK